jgi:glycosyltransferase involved in cell wall biosynthesis
MKIAVNLGAVDPKYRGGVNTYIQGLLRGLVKQAGTDIQLNLVCRDDNAISFKELSSYRNINIHILPSKNFLQKCGRELAYGVGSENFFCHYLNYLWANYTEKCDSVGDLVYTPTTFLTAFNYSKPTVVSMHDIQHVHFPEFFSARELKLRELYFNTTARVASMIQASSQFIQDDLVGKYTCLNRDRIPIISEGVDIDKFSSSHRKYNWNIRSKYSLPEKFLFYPAQLWPHKNHITILKAINRLRSENTRIPLVMTGAAYGSRESIMEYIKSKGLQDLVIYLGLVPFEDLVGLYKAAHFLIVASLYESSSLPILEAAAGGLPIIAGNTPPNIELNMQLKMTLFETLSPENLSNKIKECWDADWRLDQIEYNKEAVRQYSWINIASKYIQLFERLHPNAV